MVLIILFYNLIDFIYNEWKLYCINCIYILQRWWYACRLTVTRRVSSNSNTTRVACRAGAADTSGAPEFTPGFSGDRVARSLVFCLVDRCLSCCPFSICLSSIYGFCLSLWYLQTVMIQLNMNTKYINV